MTDTKYVIITGTGAIQKNTLQREFSAPVETLWEMITKVENLRHWWLDWQPGGIIEPKEGGRIALDDGSWIDGRITQWQPPHIFAFTWHEHLGDAERPDWFEAKTKSLLHIDLVTIGDGQTLMTLNQFISAENAIGGAAGWHHFAENLAEYLEHGKTVLHPERFDQLVKLYSN